MEYKFGYISLIGKANAGKSTLVNSLIGQKVAIISPKPQTTRNNILAVLTSNNYQLCFIDTPGIHESKNALDKYMMKNVRTAIGGADLIVYLIDSSKPINIEEKKYVERLVKNEQKVIVALTKVDISSKSKVFEKIAYLSDIDGLLDIVPISSLKQKNTDLLLDLILKQIPASPEKNFAFAEDEYTDKSLRFMVSEIIRESALKQYNQEIPHGLAINITKFEEQDDIAYIDVDIICEKDTHKSIIIGSKGSKLKKLGEDSRLQIQELLNKKVMLKLFVKVENDWRNKQNNLNDFGYNSKFD